MVQCDRRLAQLHGDVCSGAERAIGMGDVPLRMDVNELDCPASNNQRDTHERENKSPRNAYLSVVPVLRF